MSKWKKCIKCELNYAVEGEELCDVCKKELEPPGTTDVWGNDELGGEYFPNSDLGYSSYLTKRQYKDNTVTSYINAIRSIENQENMVFYELEDNIDKLVVEYSLDGEKKKLGEKGKGTWRNALCRLKEFVSYRKNYMKKP